MGTKMNVAFLFEEVTNSDRFIMQWRRGSRLLSVEKEQEQSEQFPVVKSVFHEEEILSTKIESGLPPEGKSVWKMCMRSNVVSGSKERHCSTESPANKKRNDPQESISEIRIDLHGKTRWLTELSIGSSHLTGRAGAMGRGGHAE
jgi:hypothetical protein